MKIMGFYKSTMLDYPDHLASAIFTRECNYRCPYCHNGDLVLETSSQGDVEESEIFEHLKKRRNLLEGLVISGGEPTLSSHLIPFIERVKELGLKVKLDTNGSNPSVVEKLIERNQVDYFAMDIKNSFEKYPETTGVKDVDLTCIKKSIDLIIKSNVQHEFRTTIMKEFHQERDIIEIVRYIRGADVYYLQQFEPTDKMIGKGPYTFYSVEEMLAIKKEIEQYQYVSRIDIRGRF